MSVWTVQAFVIFNPSRWFQQLSTFQTYISPWPCRCALSLTRCLALFVSHPFDLFVEDVDPTICGRRTKELEKALGLQGQPGSKQIILDPGHSVIPGTIFRWPKVLGSSAGSHWNDLSTGRRSTENYSLGNKRIHFFCGFFFLDTLAAVNIGYDKYPILETC